MNTIALLLAAGYGKRMKSELPKVLHPLIGRPMIEWCVRAVAPLIAGRPVVVVGHGKAQVQAVLGDLADYVEQAQQLGTGHAVMQAAARLDGGVDAVLVSYGDMPALRSETLAQLLDLFVRHRSDPALAFAMLTVVRDNPQGFGRIVRAPDGRIQAIVEDVDCTPEQRLIRELNPGVYCFDASWLRASLPKIVPSASGEYYLTDLVALAVAEGRTVVTVQSPVEEVDGVNTRVQLAEAAAVLRRRILERHMLAGVTIVDPATTYIDDTVQIGQDTTVLPGCLLQGHTVIGANCQIGPNSQIVDTAIADGCWVSYSVLESARMDCGAEIGPFGHLRKGAHLGEGVHMGNFGEVKDSYLGPGTKMGHFSYIGNADIGDNVNIGAGTITCNYDGVQKAKTVIGKNAFIGSDTMLVAPVTVGTGARTGAGAVVTRDVNDGETAYGVPARVKPGTSANEG